MPSGSHGRTVCRTSTGRLDDGTEGTAHDGREGRREGRSQGSGPHAGTRASTRAGRRRAAPWGAQAADCYGYTGRVRAVVPIAYSPLARTDDSVHAGTMGEIVDILPFDGGDEGLLVVAFDAADGGRRMTATDDRILLCHPGEVRPLVAWGGGRRAGHQAERP